MHFTGTKSSLVDSAVVEAQKAGTNFPDSMIIVTATCCLIKVLLFEAKFSKWIFINQIQREI